MAFTCVYGPNVDREKRLMREELAGMYSWWNCHGVWVVISMLFAFRLNVWGLKTSLNVCIISQISSLLMG